MTKAAKYVLSFIGLIIGLFILHYIFWFFYLSYWDYRVTKMCLEDGGAEVYQTVRVSQNVARQLGLEEGTIAFPLEGTDRAENSSYISRINMETLKDGTPRVVRSETNIIRAEDDKRLGSRVIYSRIGSGVMFSFGEVSSFSCMDINEISADVENQIFQTE